MFDAKSRYASLVPYTIIDRRGRAVSVVPAAPPLAQRVLGYHRHLQGERADHLAWRYLDDAAGYWRLAELNDVMLPEVLTELGEIAIPDKTR